MYIYAIIRVYILFCRLGVKVFRYNKRRFVREEKTMTAVLSTNNIHSRDNRAPAPAVHEDGSSYPWRMFFQNNQRIVDADTTAEVLDYLIPNYILMDIDEKRNARITLAQLVQVAARATILSRISPEEAESIADWEWDILSFDDEGKLDPFGWGDGTGTIGVQDAEVADQWNSTHPLVLIDTNYVPHTDIVPPLSSEGEYKEVKNIIWLRPAGEESLLRSLSRIGYITFGAPSAVAALKA